MQHRNEQINHTPLVSVCMPAYHAADTILDAVRSVLRQQVPLELLILLDDPEDGTRDALADVAEDPRVRIIPNAHRLGAAGSRNRAVILAKGNYIAFLDADDWWTDDKLMRQLKRIRKTGCVLCCTGRELMRPDGALTGRVISVPPRISYRRLLRHNCINCSSVLAERDVLLRFPMEHEDSHEDYITWMKLLRQYGDACGIRDPLLKYRLSAKGKSGNKLQSARKTYTAYRYAGFGRLTSALLFCRYAVCGVLKYLRAFLYPVLQENSDQ